ncbi:MAG: alpha/beta fold hydrolase [Ilumatobacteraceae bacterium]
MPYAEVNGQRIFFQDSGGDGPVVILAHGFLMDRSMFDPQVEALADDYRMITWDERGFGQTEFDSQPFTYWDSAKDLLGLMDHRGVDRAVVGGMSQGGFVSLRAALLAPERVRGLILLDTSSHPEPPDAVERNEQMIAMWLEVGPVDELAQAVATIIVDHPDHDARWIAKWQARPKELLRESAACLMSREDISDRLGEITCPAIVIHGTEDTAIPMQYADDLVAGLPGARPVVAVGGSHAANMTNPEPVNEALRDFLADLPA